MGAIASQITSLTIVYSNRLFRRRSKKTSKLRITGLCAGKSPGTGEFPAQMASYAENVSIWWRHHDISPKVMLPHRQAIYLLNRTDLCDLIRNCNYLSRHRIDEASLYFWFKHIVNLTRFNSKTLSDGQTHLSHDELREFTNTTGICV